MNFTLGQIKKEVAPKKKKEVSKGVYAAKLKEVEERLRKEGIMPPNAEIARATVKFLAETNLEIREKGLAFISGVGTGKTVALKIIAHYREYKFIEAYQITEESKKHDCAPAFIREKTRLVSGESSKDVIIDDVGDELTINDYSIKSEFMAVMLRERHKQHINRGDLTLISSNLGHKDLKERYGERIVSRIEQMCEVVLCNGPDLRTKGE